jgi:hypothetical protein
VGAGEGAVVGEGEGDVVGDGEGAFVGKDAVGEDVGALEGWYIISNSQHTTDSTLCIPCAAPE